MSTKPATGWIVSTRGMEPLGLAEEAGYTTGKHEAVVVRAEDYNALFASHEKLAAALDTALNEIVANRGTQHAFITLHHAAGDMPQWVMNAEALLASLKEQP